MTPTTTIHRIERVLDATPRVVVATQRGDVLVHHDAPTGTVVVTLTSRREVDFAAVTTRVTADTVHVIVPRLAATDGPSFGFQLGPLSFSTSSVAVDVDIAVPAGADVTVSTGSGDIVTTGTSAALHAKTGTGSIRADSCADADLVTGTGDLRVDEMAGGTVRTGAGDLTIGSCEGTVHARTGVGDLEITQCAGTVTAATGAGDITARLTAGRLDCRTGAGDIRITVPTGIPVWRDLTTALGDASSRIEPTGEPAPGQEHLRITAHTGTGDIRLTH